ncbi:hypothetical protein DRO97_00945 [Archaeoglobales archaeon]|nr:MAG: hypothetical protein DRO97_00945 [Archaeoglobales archaeon]
MQKKSLGVGILLTVTFFGVLAIMAMPIWNGSNFIKYADDTFNSLSKGSVYFIPEVSKEAEKYTKYINAKIKLENNDIAEKVGLLYSEVAEVRVMDNEVTISGDLREILKNALADADLAYKNELTTKYGLNGEEVLYYWWISLKKIAEYYKQNGKFDEALFIEDEVITKAIEPAYNFYGLKAELIGKELFLTAGLLAFYVVYTVWWGFAIFFLFEGFGLRMEKAKERKEV